MSVRTTGKRLLTGIAVLAVAASLSSVWTDWESDPPPRTRKDKDPDRERIVRLIVVSRPVRMFRVGWSIGPLGDPSDRVKIGVYKIVKSARPGTTVTLSAHLVSPRGGILDKPYVHCAGYVDETRLERFDRSTEIAWQNCDISFIVP